MNDRERVHALLNGKAEDRIPCIEWASWWDQTVNKWRSEEPSLPHGSRELFEHFGLDGHSQYWLSPRGGGCPHPQGHGAPIIEDEADFERILPYLFPEDNLKNLENTLLSWKADHQSGSTSVWYTFEGFFWFPRTLFGIENHLYAFYDYPELMKEINQRLLDYHKKAVKVIYSVLCPEFMTIAEDMSYNHGPMLSKEFYDEFMAPYYKELIPLIKEHGTKVFIDTDGDVEPLIPWFKECGIEGVLPLERQAGVDVNRIREKHPGFLMIGGFDKTVMHCGEDAMRREFERILPAIKSGGYIPAVDHQTPPDVSIENYRIFVRLLKEYSLVHDKIKNTNRGI